MAKAGHDLEELEEDAKSATSNNKHTMQQAKLPGFVSC